MTAFKKALSAAAVAAVTFAALPALADGPGASARIQVPNPPAVTSVTVYNPLAAGDQYAAPSQDHVRRTINDRN
jgi:sugar/nucleoside kinase (ribokinase family)